MTAHDIATSIAAALASDPIVAPLDVYLDAIPETVEIRDRPLAVVTPKSEGRPRGGSEWEVAVVLAIDSGATNSNGAAPEKTPQGFYRLGAGGRLATLANDVRDRLADWDLGAIPVETTIEYDLASIPYQAATITARFEAVETFQPF